METSAIRKTIIVGFILASSLGWAAGHQEREPNPVSTHINNVAQIRQFLEIQVTPRGGCHFMTELVTIPGSKTKVRVRLFNTKTSVQKYVFLREANGTNPLSIWVRGSTRWSYRHETFEYLGSNKQYHVFWIGMDGQGRVNRIESRRELESQGKRTVQAVDFACDGTH